MLFISELLPNPAGKDTVGEWIELCHTGDAPIELSGWKISDASGKVYTFQNETIASHACVSYPYIQTKITLNNSGDTITLIDAQGTIIDTMQYAESMGDDIAVARDENMHTVLTSKPTPGKENIIVTPLPSTKNTARGWDVGYNTQTTYETATTSNDTREDQLTLSDTSVTDVMGAGALIALCATISFWYFFKKLKNTPS